jgi:hypothetical protein
MSYFRKERGKSQKIFLINQEMKNDNKSFSGSFAVAGTTGNVYNVLINEKPSCSCPDFTTRKNRCKHIYFILIRILKVHIDKEEQKAYSHDELKEMFVNMGDTCKALLVTDQQRDAYLKACNKKDGKIVLKDTDDDCLICFDPLNNGDQLIYCEYSCGKPIHKECIEIWSKTQKLKTTNCLYCLKIMDAPPAETPYIKIY